MIWIRLVVFAKRSILQQKATIVQRWGMPKQGGRGILEVHCSEWVGVHFQAQSFCQMDVRFGLHQRGSRFEGEKDAKADIGDSETTQHFLNSSA